MASDGDRTGHVLVWIAGALAVLAALTTLVLSVRYTTTRPSLELDASGRWVTIGRVHPGFAAAVDHRAVAARAARLA